MTEQEKERLKPIIRRLRETRRDETICLAYWETALLLKYIDERGAGKSGLHENQPRSNQINL